jgi:hypothetical protein
VKRLKHKKAIKDKVKKEEVVKDLKSNKEGLSKKEVREEPKVTLNKKGKGKKVANKSLASSIKRNAVGRIVSSSCVKVDLAVYKTVVNKY